MKKLLTTIIILTSLLFIYFPNYAQIKVTPGGDFAIGQNYVTNQWFKTEINGERKAALALSTRHEEPWGWASISDAFNPYTKHWIVSDNGYSNHHFFVTTNGAVYARAYHTLSDQSIKENIQTIDNSSDLISALNPVYYNYKESFAPLANDEEEILPQIGFIAQEVQEILPQLVHQEDSAGLLRVNYQGIIPLLVKHAQKQDKKIKTLENALQKYVDNAESQESNYYPVLK